MAIAIKTKEEMEATETRKSEREIYIEVENGIR